MSMGFIDNVSNNMVEIIARYILIVRSNTHQVSRILCLVCYPAGRLVVQVDTTSRIEPGKVELEGVGAALYPVLALLNHSCNSNTIRIFTNNSSKAILVALRYEYRQDRHSHLTSSPEISRQERR